MAFRVLSATTGSGMQSIFFKISIVKYIQVYLYVFSRKEFEVAIP